MVPFTLMERQALGRSGRRVVTEGYSWRSSGLALEKVLVEASGVGAAPAPRPS